MSQPKDANGVGSASGNSASVLATLVLVVASIFGLPAAQELLSRHDGLIEFESKPGKTVFFLRIPLSKETVKND